KENYGHINIKSAASQVQWAPIGWKKCSNSTYFYSLSNLNHGLMMVGPSGSGKSKAWRILLKALERYENMEG
ncbi:dynein heavy cytoplasmic isoform X2, partial [Brachionus plicatilis]